MLRRRSQRVLFRTEVMLMLVCGTCAAMNVKTALEGDTVKEIILKLSTLGKDDQLLVYFQENSTSNRHEMCAQYFCDNGICKNDPTSVGQFQEQGGDIVLVIDGVNMTNSGIYFGSINGLKDVHIFSLDVQKSAEHNENIAETQMHQSSALTWFLISAFAVAVLLLIVVYCTRKKLRRLNLIGCTRCAPSCKREFSRCASFFVNNMMNCQTNPAAEDHELENLETGRT